MTIKYSIVIPTKTRAYYLQYAIKSVLASRRKDIELVVSDNFSSDETSKILTKISDPRLRVVTPDFSLPMVGHYEFAISKAKGDWVTILGDDDAVMPYIFESLDYYINKYPKIDIISSNRAYYFWKGCEKLYGKLVVSYDCKFYSKIRSTKTDLLKSLLGLKSCFELPQIYTSGIIRKKLYEEIKKNSGGYFYHSIIPDIYSAVAVCLNRNKYLRTEEPLFWTGTSNKSFGMSDRIYKDAKNFAKDSKEIKSIPKNISNQISLYLHSNSFSCLYVYECFLKYPVSNFFFKADSIRIFNLAAIYIESINRNSHNKKKIRSEIFKECKIYKIFKVNFFLIVFTLYAINRISKFSYILKKLSIKFNLFGNISFRSNDKNKFKNILDASNHIIKLKANIKKIIF